MTEGDCFVIKEMKEIKEKLDTICNRLDNLEHSNSRYKDKIVEITEQPGEAVNSQEQMVI